MAKTPTCIVDQNGPFHLIVTDMTTHLRVIVKDTYGYVRAEADSIPELERLIDMANVATINGRLQ